MAEDLEQLDEWFGEILKGLSPAQRKRAAMKLGRELRRSNLKRVADNVEPDGSTMKPRKARKDRRGRLRAKAGGKMFRRLRLQRELKIGADETGVELHFVNGAVDRVAAVHHFGEVDSVGRDRKGQIIRVRYAARRLLGFSQEDRQLALDVAAELIEETAR